jgi:hypothetical protein
MLNEKEIRTAIVQLAKPIADRGWCSSLEDDQYVIDGLAWALLRDRPEHGKLGDLQELQRFLVTCGIPCQLVPFASHYEIRWDKAWMKAHGLQK